MPSGTATAYKTHDIWKNFTSVNDGDVYYRLTLTAQGNGTLSYGDSEADNTTEGVDVREGTTMTLAIAADEGYRLSELMVNGVDRTDDVTGGTLSLGTMSQDLMVAAVFEQTAESNIGYLTVGDFNAILGGTVTMPIDMENSNAITAFQFELALPNGVTIESAALTSRKSNQTLSYSKLANGNYQLVAFSSDSRAFSGNDGELVRVQLKVGDAVAAGDYTIEVKNIELTTTDEKSCNPADCSATLTVSDVQLGDANGDGKISITDAVAVVNKLLGWPSSNFREEAADVNGDGRITITDAVAIVNIVLGKRSANARVGEPQ